MDANSKSITFALVATLLLAIAANADLGNKSKEPDYKFSFTDKAETTVWIPKPICTDDEEIFLNFLTSSTRPKSMLKELRDKLNSLNNKAERSQKVTAEREFILRLISHAEPKDDCSAVSSEDFLKLFTMCGNKQQFLRYKNFMLHYATPKFKMCAGKIMDTFENLDDWMEHTLYRVSEFLEAGLSVENSLSAEEIYSLVKKVNLAGSKINVERMVKVALEYQPASSSGTHQERQEPPVNKKDKLEFMINEFDRALFRFGVLFRENVNIVQVARGIGAIEDKDLKKKYPAINEFVRFAAEMDHEETYKSIVRHLTNLY